MCLLYHYTGSELCVWFHGFIIYNKLVKYADDKAEGGILPVKVQMLLDEFPNSVTCSASQNGSNNRQKCGVIVFI